MSQRSSSKGSSASKDKKMIPAWSSEVLAAQMAADIVNMTKTSAKRAILKTQVIFPSNRPSNSAYMGPFNPEITEACDSFFPSSKEHRVLAARGQIKTHYLSKPHDTFRMSYPANSKREDYLAWGKRMREAKGAQWKTLGIYDLINLSFEPIKYNTHLLLAALQYWHPSTSTFHTRMGMISPTLFDVSEITGLRPHVELPDHFNLDVNLMGHLYPDKSSMSFTLFMANNRKTEGPVSDKEHVAFLLYWLSRYAFCVRGIQVSNSLHSWAAALHSGFPLPLGPCLLASLFDNLFEAYTDLTSDKKFANFSGPLWLLQLWLNAIFSKKMNVQDVPQDVDTSIEGYRLAHFHHRSSNKTHTDIFAEYLVWFDQIHLQNVNLNPFASKPSEPNWFKCSLATNIPDEDKMELWSSYLMPKFIFTPPNHTGTFRLFTYNPNFCARQFGLVQTLTYPCFVHNDILPVALRAKNKDALAIYLNKKNLDLSFKLIPFDLYNCTTKSFGRWWKAYYEANFPEGGPVLDLADMASSTVQDRQKKKSKGTHVREIQNFEKYFKVKYNPLKLSRTVEEAADNLEERIRDYISSHPEKRETYVPRTPPLPSALFGLAIPMPPPSWDMTESWKTLRNEVQPLKDKITWTKCFLPNYRGPLGGSTRVLDSVYGKS